MDFSTLLALIFFIGPCVLAISLTLYTFWYIRLRKRLHIKGILDFKYDGTKLHYDDPTKKTIFYYMRKEKEYDNKTKRND